MSSSASGPRNLVALAVVAILLLAPALRPSLAPALSPAFGGEPVAQSRTSVVHGAEIRVIQRSEGNLPAELRGELLAVERDRLWLLFGEAEIRSALFPDIRRVDMDRHHLGSRRLLTWTALAAGVTGLAMFSACSSVDGAESCGGFTLGWVAVWAGVGGLAFVAARPTRRVHPDGLEALRPWARFPQGLPENFDPASGRRP